MRIQDIGLFNGEDTLYTEPIISMEEISGYVNLKHIFKKKASLDSLTLRNGRIDLVRFPDGSSNFKGGERKTTVSKKEKTSDFEFSLNPNLIVNLEKIHFQYRDSLKNNKNLKVFIESIKSDVHPNDSTSQLKLNLHIDSLTFNSAKGPYLANSHITGKAFASSWHGGVRIEAPELLINDMPFVVKSSIFGKGSDSLTSIFINKPDASFKRIVPLLTTHIQEKLQPFYVDSVFPAVAHIRFIDPTNPRVRVDYTIPDNAISVGPFNFARARANGIFYNRVYDDKRQYGEPKENIRLIIDRFQSTLVGLNLDVQNTVLTYTPTSKEILRYHAFLDGKAKAMSAYFPQEDFRFLAGRFTAEASGVGGLRNLPKFITDMDATLDLKDAIINYEPTKTKFIFQNFDVVKNGHNAQFAINSKMPISKSEYSLTGKIDNLTTLFFPDQKDYPIATRIKFYTPKTSVKDFEYLLGNSVVDTVSNGSKPKKSDLEISASVSNIKQVLQAINQSFEPTFSVQIDSLNPNKDLWLKNFYTKLYYRSNTQIAFDSTYFDVGGNGLLNLQADVDISDPKFTSYKLNLDSKHLNLRKILPKVDYFGVNLLKDVYDLPRDLNLNLAVNGRIDDDHGAIPEDFHAQIDFDGVGEEPFNGNILVNAYENGNDTLTQNDHIQTEVHIKGNPNFINNYFPNSEFKFLNGDFTINTRYQGNVPNVPELVRNAYLDITLTNTNLLYQPTQTLIPFNRFQVNVDDNIGELGIDIQTDSTRLEVFGLVDNLSSFMDSTANDKRHDVQFRLHSDYFNWQEFKKAFQINNASANNETIQDSTSVEADSESIKSTINNIIQTYNPNVDIAFEKLVINPQWTFDNVTTKLHKDNGQLALTDTGFDYIDGRFDLEATLDLREKEQLPFDMELQTDSLALSNVLTHFNYFNNYNLKTIDSLQAVLNFKLKLASIYSLDSGTLMSKRTNGMMAFVINDAYISGYDKLEELSDNFLLRDRFNTIKFSPIKNTVTIKNGDLYFPYMEINSTVGPVFAEGEVIDRHGDFWLTIPLKTIFRRYTPELPILWPNAYGRNKVFVEFKFEPDANSETQFHLSKKKYFYNRYTKELAKQRWKAYKKLMRQSRRDRRRGK